MKAHVMRCPDCGAQLKADVGLTECRYCGTSVMIEGGQASPSAEPRADVEPPATRSGGSSTPAKPSSGGPSPAVVLSVSLGLLAITIVGLISSSSADHEAMAERIESQRNEVLTAARSRSASSAPSPSAPMLRWEANHPIVTSFDDDAVPDMLTYLEGADDAYFVSALSGADGRQLWRSEAIPGLSGGKEPRIFLGDSTAFAAGSTGELTAFSSLDGGTLWTIRLAEIVESLHAVGPGDDAGAVTVKLKDGNQVRVELERGTLAPVPEGDPLGTALPSSDSEHRGRATASLRTISQLQFGDVRPTFLIDANDGSFHLGLGKRRKGTQIPILVKYSLGDDERRPEAVELWKTQVPGVDPLQGRLPFGFASFLHADSDYACVAYVRADDRTPTPSRLAAFAMADGKRLWDLPIPGKANLTSVTVVSDRVYVVTWKGLTVLEAETGVVALEVDRVPE